jgi:hypothetical protein
MNGKTEITFVCYKYNWDDGVGTMFLFYPNGEWDEDKLTLDEALVAYPSDQFEWINADDSEVEIDTSMTPAVSYEIQVEYAKGQWTALTKQYSEDQIQDALWQKQEQRPEDADSYRAVRVERSVLVMALLAVNAQVQAPATVLQSWEIWSEGFSATGQHGTAQCFGTFQAETFKDACQQWVDADASRARVFKKDQLTFWGCRLFDNEAEARLRFG